MKERNTMQIAGKAEILFRKARLCGLTQDEKVEFAECVIELVKRGWKLDKDGFSYDEQQSWEGGETIMLDKFDYVKITMEDGTIREGHLVDVSGDVGTLAGGSSNTALFMPDVQIEVLVRGLDPVKFERVHATTYFIDDHFTLGKYCQCAVCRYIRCDDGDEEYEQNFVGISHQRFDERLVDLGLEYWC